MNHYIHIALIFWTLGFFYLAAGRVTHIVHLKGPFWEFSLYLLLSFLSLFTALLAVGQYIN